MMTAKTATIGINISTVLYYAEHGTEDIHKALQEHGYKALPWTTTEKNGYWIAVSNQYNDHKCGPYVYWSIEANSDNVAALPLGYVENMNCIVPKDLPSLFSLVEQMTKTDFLSTFKEVEVEMPEKEEQTDEFNSALYEEFKKKFLSHLSLEITYPEEEIYDYFDVIAKVKFDGVTILSKEVDR